MRNTIRCGDEQGSEEHSKDNEDLWSLKERHVEQHAQIYLTIQTRLTATVKVKCQEKIF